MRAGYLAVLVLMTTSCTQKPQSPQCPDPAMVAPASVGGAAEVQTLAAMLSGPDQENAIIAGTQELHRRDHSLSADRIIDILVAADCAGHQARLGSAYDPAQRTKVIASQVNAIVKTFPPGGG